MSSIKNTFVVNIYGGPNTGKSVTAAMLYGALAISGKYGTVAHVQEYAKELVWKIQKGSVDAQKKLDNQLLVSTVQTDRIVDICGIADIIVTDSPVRAGLIYHNLNVAEGKTESCENKLEVLFKIAERNYNEINIVLERDKSIPFDNKGRIHNEDESHLVDQKIKEMLTIKGIPFTVITNRLDIVSVISDMEKVFSNVKNKIINSVLDEKYVPVVDGGMSP